jgi:hypothetical protein
MGCGLIQPNTLRRRAAHAGWPRVGQYGGVSQVGTAAVAVASYDASSGNGKRKEGRAEARPSSHSSLLLPKGGGARAA